MPGSVILRLEAEGAPFDKGRPSNQIFFGFRPQNDRSVRKTEEAKG